MPGPSSMKAMAETAFLPLVLAAVAPPRAGRRSPRRSCAGLERVVDDLAGGLRAGAVAAAALRQHSLLAAEQRVLVGLVVELVGVVVLPFNLAELPQLLAAQLGLGRFGAVTVALMVVFLSGNMAARGST